MCGIGGILRVTPPGDAAAALSRPLNQAIPEAWLEILDESIKHRGPDGQGRFRDHAVRADGSVVDVALVHRRLSIIDHAGGAQPMVSALPLPEGGSRRKGGERATDPGAPSFGTSSGGAGAADALPSPLLFHGRPNDPVVYSALPGAAQADRVAVVFNGCIYNHRELRKELQAAGHEFVTDHSDTEVLVHGWREWERGLFERLDGMFAVGIWDGGRGTLTIARDAFGEKPLYWAGGDFEASTVVVFSSCAPSVVRLAARAPLLINPWAHTGPASSIRPWILFGWNQTPPVPSLRELVIGQVQWWPSSSSGSRCPEGQFALQPSWQSEYVNPTLAPLSAIDVDDSLRNAVHSRLESDVPLGLFLSGGVDSALIAAYALQVRPDLAAYTVRMPSSEFDESEAASRTASHLGLRHEVLDCDPRPVDDLPEVICQLGLPFGDSSLLPSMWVSRAARRQVSVALAGDGGDELYLGYDRHRALPWLRNLGRMPRDKRAALALAANAGGGRGRRLDRASRLLNASAHDGYKDLVAIFAQPFASDLGLLREGEFGWGRTGHFGMTVADNRADDGMMDRLALRFDRQFYLPCDLLRKTDTASMAVALEVRAPMLELRHARAVINAPIGCLMPKGKGGGRKGLLRQVARKYLPAEIVDRPKMGFAIPIGEWFRSDYGGMRTLLYDRLNSREPFGPDSLGINSMINMNFVRQMLKEHDDAGRSGLFPWKGRDHSQRLYMLLVLSIWADWLGGIQSGKAAKQQSSK